MGRVALEKNLGFLPRVTEEIRRSLPEVLFVIAGEGPARALLARTVAKRGLTHNVRFIRYLGRKTECPPATAQWMLCSWRGNSVRQANTMRQAGAKRKWKC